MKNKANIDRSIPPIVIQQFMAHVNDETMSNIKPLDKIYLYIPLFKRIVLKILPTLTTIDPIIAKGSYIPEELLLTKLVSSTSIEYSWQPPLIGYFTQIYNISR
ncbi:unnamed protein product [Rotaria sp. Silwood2]|nr:unnamed protein product [Rotaria sp. Silwood2]CAF2788327.1 unnamed protein product [Rotaria sp. Silwood2]CAF3173814.1 unnamed protein product [Rotaria sp. Silwood2]CAF3883999.1 unnamed protein product [Rotaria sp. Silwood2]CAF4034090.1 unnamed protein product [Rotaria sp. Silwood2]